MQYLHPLIESLNEEIKINSFDGQNLSKHKSLLDLIVLDEIFDNEDKLKACFFKDSDLKEINPIYKSFNKIRNVYCYDFKEAQNILDALDQTSIKEIENIKFEEMNVLEYKSIASRHSNYKIHTLDYSFFIWKSISEEEFEIISQINPRKLYQLILIILNYFNLKY